MEIQQNQVRENDYQTQVMILYSSINIKHRNCAVYFEGFGKTMFFIKDKIVLITFSFSIVGRERENRKIN